MNGDMLKRYGAEFIGTLRLSSSVAERGRL